ncbi:formate dehydrogenase accessory sulfurtransferase FdhD [Marispirochaeta aestuarii]|uniref:formate dehydrogenase accessory sulfurtransferase FdhD n=1 Tax=Marispirochaeta aestuarii TaxID=1963862 RepID=UPI0029C7A5B9|nr:formate dehydrogenase accessory sulfurtransferase FdhD [Marispirochaeta aestuarii]
MSIIHEVKPQVAESEVFLYADNKLLHRFHCTPEALKELTIGHLFCNGFIQSATEISHYEEEAGDPDNISIHISINREDFNPIPPVQDLKVPELTDLQALMQDFFNCAEKYKTHGGIHCSALFDGKSFVAQYEDVGRHNAFDKVTGKSLLTGLNPANLIYFTSGRVNSEIAEKAGRCGFPLIVSRSIATTRACEIARKHGVGIIGRISSDQPLLFNKGRAYA